MSGIMYKYVDSPIKSPTAFKLAKWMDEIKDVDRIKASKIYEMISKYEALYKKNNWMEYEVIRGGGCTRLPSTPLNIIPPTYEY